MTAADIPITPDEANALFADLADAPALVVAVSGGPDSTALLWLLARWRHARSEGPRLTAVTVDHGLRREAPGEARAVKRLCATLGVAHQTKRWRGEKPATAIQAEARTARYELLAAAARAAKASAILTAHTQDDQAETVLMRLARGSGVNGLAAMARRSLLGGMDLVRPLLGIPKARLIATLKDAGIDHATDHSNSDPKFLRPRLRALLPLLAEEGLDATGLARLSRRMARADLALAAMTDAAERDCAKVEGRATEFDGAVFAACPAEIRIRLLGRAIGRAEGGDPPQLAKLEALVDALASASSEARFRRTLGGALLTLSAGRLSVASAPPRRVHQGSDSSSLENRRGRPR